MAPVHFQYGALEQIQSNAEQRGANIFSSVELFFAPEAYSYI
jgi:hypothetical protein